MTTEAILRSKKPGVLEALRRLFETQLPNGKGNLGSGTLCVMQMVNVLDGAVDHGTEVAYHETRDVTDAPKSVCAVLRDYGIQLNDSLGEGPRQRLKEYVVRFHKAGLDTSKTERRRMIISEECGALGIIDGPCRLAAKLAKDDPTRAFQVLDRLIRA